MAGAAFGRPNSPIKAAFNPAVGRDGFSRSKKRARGVRGLTSGMSGVRGLKLATASRPHRIVQASVGLIETYFVGKLGTDALAGGINQVNGE